MTERPSPVLLRRRVGSKLRERRKELGLTLAKASDLVDRTHGWLSKLENGEISIHPSIVRLLLMVYNCPADEVNEWVQVARESNERGWWEADEYKKVVLDDFEDYLGMEASVSRLSYFEIQLVPGIAQTADYARALLQAQLPADRQHQCEDLVKLRTARQERLLDDGAPEVRMVIDESAIRRPVGGAEVMREQLDQLLKLGKRPNIDIRVLPVSSGAEAAVGTPFTYLEFYGDPDFVFLESITSSYYVKDPGEVQRHRIVFERLMAAALTGRGTTGLIKKAMDDLP